MVGEKIEKAAVVAALSVDTLIHPVDTLITRIQSPNFSTQYKSASGAFRRSLFRNLYQGFGPTLVAGLPASAGFWAVYEKLKTSSERAKERGQLRGVPLPLLHAASSAAGELVSCAIMSPAEVLKQNAQVQQQSASSAGRGAASPRGNQTMAVLRKFITRPTKLWTGYPMMVASYLPGVSITMTLYEYIKEGLLSSQGGRAQQSVSTLFGIAGLSAGIASGCTSCLLVPIDVIKTRMRLLAGSQVSSPAMPAFSFSANSVAASQPGGRWQTPRNVTFLSVTKETLRVEGARGLFRGLGLTSVAATVGSALYFGIYESTKLCIRGFSGGPANNQGSELYLG